MRATLRNRTQAKERLGVVRFGRQVGAGPRARPSGPQVGAGPRARPPMLCRVIGFGQAQGPAPTRASPRGVRNGPRPKDPSTSGAQRRPTLRTATLWGLRQGRWRCRVSPGVPERPISTLGDLALCSPGCRPRKALSLSYLRRRSTPRAQPTEGQLAAQWPSVGPRAQARRAAFIMARPVGSPFGLRDCLLALKRARKSPASPLPSFTPSWSKELMFQMKPWKATLAS